MQKPQTRVGALRGPGIASVFAETRKKRKERGPLGVHKVK